MPYKTLKNGVKIYSYLTPGEEAVFWRQSRDSQFGAGGVPVPARAMRPGSRYSVSKADAPGAAPPPPEDQEA